MDAYIFQAALWCQDCTRDNVEEILAKARGEKVTDYIGLDFSSVWQQANDHFGYKSESDYDSDTFPKGPFENGGGEADTPQHCDGCGCFLENSLTKHGYRYVEEQLLEYARDGEGSDYDTLSRWADYYYGWKVYKPGETTLEDIQDEYSVQDDDLPTALEWWFKIAGELHDRGAPIPEDWKYDPGALGKGVSPDDYDAIMLAAATTEVLMKFMETVKADCERLKED